MRKRTAAIAASVGWAITALILTKSPEVAFFMGASVFFTLTAIFLIMTEPE